MNEHATSMIKRARAFGTWYGFGIVWIDGHEVSATKNARGHLIWRLDGKVRAGLDIVAYFA